MRQYVSLSDILSEHVNRLQEREEEEKNKVISVFQQLEMSKLKSFLAKLKIFRFTDVALPGFHLRFRGTLNMVYSIYEIHF